jgi:PAS domain S-box-containing protein
MKSLFYEEMMDNTTDSIAYLSLDGRYLDVSQKKASNCGFKDRRDMIGKFDKDFFLVPEEAEIAWRQHVYVITTGNSIEDCTSQRTLDGKTLQYSVSRSPIKDSNGKIIGSHVTARDISDRVEQERKNNAMSQQVLDMVKIVSHDLSSPLTTISALAKQSMRGHFGKEGSRVSLELDQLAVNSFTEIYKRSLTLRGAVSDYLHSFSNLTEGQELEKELVDVRELLDEVVEELEDEIRQNNSTIDSSLGEIPYGVVVVRVNRIQLKITYRNLIKNALKHGGENCTISFGYEGWGEGFTLNVFNDGPPVPKEEIQSLFEPFVQGKSVPKGDGLGIGLHIIRNMIRSNGGEMWYETTWSNHPNFKFTVLK